VCSVLTMELSINIDVTQRRQAACINVIGSLF
jgi:hypothetical protein